MDTALVVACISGAVALASATFSGWTQLQVTKRERESKEEERRSEAKVVLDRYRGPLLDAAWQLGNRLDNIRNRSFYWYLSIASREKDVKLTTLFHFANYLGWREYIRNQVQLLRFENEEDTRLTAIFLSDVSRILSSDNLDERWAMFWGDEQRTIGELMSQFPSGAPFKVLGIAEFRRQFDMNYLEWMGRFSDDLFSDTAVTSNRLRLLQWALYGLVRQLDEEGTYGGGWIQQTAAEISQQAPPEHVTGREKQLREHLAAIKPST